MKSWSFGFRQRRPAAGARPGTLEAGHSAGEVTIDVIRYRRGESERYRDVTAAKARELAEDGWVTWVDVIGLGDTDELAQVSELFDLHPLVLDDVVTIPQRPKHDVHGENSLFVVRMVELGEEIDLDIEQLAVVVGGDIVVTFQEKPGDLLEPVRRRIADGIGPIRTLGGGYLAYALVDAVVDNYYPVIEKLGDVLEELEERIIEGAGEEVIDELARVRGVLLRLRRSVVPLRDTAARMVRNGEADDPVVVYFRSVVDHLAQIAEVVDSYREGANGLLNTHLSVIAHRTNDVMRVLTVIASIFIPLTFIAGLYGMNFENMPELKFKYAYPIAIGAMVTVGAVLLWLFRRRGWLGRRR